MSAQPSRYTRSFGGMVGALIVTVLFVLAFVLWRGLFREDVEESTPAVDWRDSVSVAEGAGRQVVHPRELPLGWKATSVDLVAVGDPRWGLGILTDEGRFVGIRQEDGSISDLAEIYIDEKAENGPDVRIASDIASTWQTWSDSGGDHGYATQIGDEAVLVYGSAPVEDLEEFIGLLTR